MSQPDSSPPIPEPGSEVRRTVPPHRRALGALLVLVGVALFGLLLFRLAGPKPVPPPKVVRYTPQQAAAARQDFDALRAQLLAPPPAVPPPTGKGSTPRAVGRPNTTGPPPHATMKVAGPVRLQLSEADLNTYLATDPQAKTLLAARGIQAVQLSLQAPHGVTCRASLLYKGQKTNIQITGDLLPDRANFARFVATKAQLGTLPLPSKIVTAQADRIAGKFLGRVRGRFPVAVQSIQVVGDRLILTGLRQPAPQN